MIDLHIHTTSSDGSDEPKDILIKAQQLGLKYISITDHDSIGAYIKLKRLRIARYFEGIIIPGCEFTAAHSGQPVEILGYGIDLETIDSMGIVSDKKFLERENEYLRKMIKVCKSLKLTCDDTLHIKSGKYFATQVMHSHLRKYPENEKHFTKETWESINAFYRTCVSNEENPFFLDHIKDYPTIEQVAKLIKKAGGKAFLAHLYGYFAKDHREFLDSIVSLNVLDGIECYHSLHTAEQTKYLLDYCTKHNLYASGGSDYHGILKPTVNIGESAPGVNIPFEILKPWLPSNE